MPPMETPEAGGQRPSLTTQAGWLLFAKIVGFAISFAAPLLLVRLLNQYEFGLYKQAFLLVFSAIPVLTLAFHMNVFYFLPREKERKGQVVFNTIIVNCCIGTCTFFFLALWPQVLAVIFGSDDLTPQASLIGAVILVWMVGNFLEVVATANEDVKYSTFFIITAQCTKSVVLIAAGVFYATVRAMLLASLIQGLIQTCILIWYLHKRFGRFWQRIDWPLLREQIRYTVPLGLAGLAITLQSDFHMYVVANRFSAAEYAIYAVACVQLPLIGLLRESVNGVLLPRVAYLQQKGSTAEIVALLASAVRKLALVYWPLYGFLLVAGYEFLVLLYSPQYADSWPIFRINLTLVPLTLIITDPVMRAYVESMRDFLAIRVVTSLLLIPAVYFATAHFGMIGSISAVVLVVSLERILMMVRVGKFLHLAKRDLMRFRDLGKIAAASTAAALASAGMRWLVLDRSPLVILACSGMVFGLVYAAALIVLQVPTNGEISLVRRKLIWLSSRLPA